MERGWLLEEERAMEWSLDCAVIRVWDEVVIAEWMIWRGVGLGGR